MTKQTIKLVYSDELSAEEIEKAEIYSAEMAGKGCQPIHSARHLSLLTGYTEEYILAAANAQHLFYRTFELCKGHKTRTIAAPLTSLKNIQRYILDNCLASYRLEDQCKSYRKGISIKDNAKFHKRQKYILKMDVRNFFPSIKINSVHALFLELGYSKQVCTLLSNLTCMKNSLPQGAPTSGQISNIFLSKFDLRVFQWCRERDLRYTRYADDLTISGKDIDEINTRNFVEECLDEYGLELNHKKTTLCGPGHRKRVTGIIVNEKLNIEKNRRRKLRQEIHYILKHGASEHIHHTMDESIILMLNRISGELSFQLFIRPRDEYLLAKKIEISKLSRQYIPT